MLQESSKLRPKECSYAFYHLKELPEQMTIGEFARFFGVNDQTLRYYERQGLLNPKRKEGSNYRYYSRREAKKFVFIRCAQSLGFTLKDIQKLITYGTNDGHDREEIKQMVKQKKEQAELEMVQLEKILSGLTRFDEILEGERETPLDTGDCPILDHLEL